MSPWTVRQDVGCTSLVDHALRGVSEGSCFRWPECPMQQHDAQSKVAVNALSDHVFETTGDMHVCMYG